MPTKRYPLENNGPERLEITWGNTSFSKCVVKLDGTTIDTFSTPDLVRGHTTRMPNGAFLNLQRAGLTIFSNNLQAILNGQPLPGSTQARPQIVIRYAFSFGALSVFSLLVGVFGGIGILTSNPGSQSSLIGGVGFLLGGLVIGALCALTARGLWRLQSWALTPAVIIVIMFEALLVFAFVNGYFLTPILMIGALFPLYQLLTSDEFRSPDAKRKRAAARAKAASATPGEAGPSLEQFQRQVETALSAETRARLQIGFSSSPIISAVYSVDGARWGWFECAGFDQASGQCALWKVNSPSGLKKVVEANESALLSAINTQ